MLFGLFTYFDNGCDVSFLNGADQQLVKAEEIVSNLYNNSIFFCEDTELLKDVYHDAYISLAPVHNCNLRCKYCFATHGEKYLGKERTFTKEVLEQSLNYLYFSSFKDVKSFRIDFVSGGEPLLAFDVIQNLISVCDRLDKLHDKKTKFWLCTNGTILDEKYFELLNENKFNIGISLDGPQEENDKYRVFDNGVGSYEKASETIQSILQNPNLSRNFKNIWGLVVITSQTQSLVDILKHHKEIGFSRVQMKVVRTTDTELTINEKSIEKLKELYNDLSDFLIENIKNDDIAYFNMFLNDNDYFGKIIRRIILRTIISNRCQAGKNKVSLAANGDLYPCDSFVGNSDLVIGNAIEKHSDPKDICNVFCSGRDTCCGCWDRFVCGGDCFHNSLLKTGDILIPDPMYCDLEKHLIELAVSLLCYLNTEKPNIYNAIKERLTMELKAR
jgi:uncharacterized protein